MPVDEYLQDLRRERFSPAALARFARRLARHVRDSMVANPGAVRSVWSLALLYFALAFAASVVIALRLDHHLAIDFFLRTALGILPVFALVTFSLDLLRDPSGYRLSAINVPTALTLLRVVLAPGIVLFLTRRHFELALGLYLFAAVSDVADGWIARATRQITRLGTVIDPVGDIVFNLAILWGLWGARLLPGWVFAVGALRYGVLLLGGLSLHLFVGPVRIQPTWFGRATGVVMSSLIALLIVVEVAGGTLAQRLVPLTEIALGGLLVATVGQVLALGWYNLKVMTQPAPEAGRVVGDVRWGRP